MRASTRRSERIAEHPRREIDVPQGSTLRIAYRAARELLRECRIAAHGIRQLRLVPQTAVVSTQRLDRILDLCATQATARRASARTRPPLSPRRARGRSPCARGATRVISFAAFT